MGPEDHVVPLQPLPSALAGQEAESMGVRTLTRAQSREVDAKSLNRFGHLSGDVLDWGGVPVLDSAVYTDEADAVRRLRELVARRASDSAEVVVLWGSSGMPTVKMPVAALDRYLVDIVEVGPQFWLYLPAERYLVECLPDGRITGASVPDEEEDV
ncbi:hypothetical protein ACQPYE_26020 [Actinosynnema sp. CA-299493]